MLLRTWRRLDLGRRVDVGPRLLAVAHGDRSRPSPGVVLGPALRIGERLVCVAELLPALVLLALAVALEVARQPAVGDVDLGRAGVIGDAEHGVRALHVTLPRLRVLLWSRLHASIRP